MTTPKDARQDGSQFDETTERFADEIIAILQTLESDSCFEDVARAKIHEMRNSAKESLEILARAVNAECSKWAHPEDNVEELIKAIAAVKQAGNWPLKEKP